ncbi:MAG: hypothetical protein DLM60_24120 [Pseudonocardiales bacterium]|nr:MAG: hypothetical protein DLM60_24120 [Pseudonocardiales bacterium]
MWDGEEPPTIADYVHISTDVRFRHGANWVTLAVHGCRFFADAYPLLRSVADLVQLQSAAFADAVRSSLASYHDLLSAAAQMPIHDEIGLYGELLALSHLISSTGPHTAMKAWRGGDEREEHDFGLADDDVEVKTTTADSRRHWISSLDQMRPTAGRKLWVLSIQLTGAGASEAARLPDVMARVEKQLPAELRNAFWSRIVRTRYRPEQPHDTFRLLRMRSTPACFLVDENFPRIDRDILARGGAPVAGLGEVNYVILLDSTAPAVDPPAALLGFGHKGTNK